MARLGGRTVLNLVSSSSGRMGCSVGEGFGTGAWKCPLCHSLACPPGLVLLFLSALLSMGISAYGMA